MPHSFTNYINNALWDDPKKIQSRNDVIILNYHNYFNSSLPSNKQYWTMGGSYYDKNNNPIHGELGQLLDNNIITKEQFYPVDKEPIIISKNKSIYPDVNWINGDFLDTMISYKINNNFNPGIINYDGVMQKSFGTRYLKKILTFIDHNHKDELLLIANFCLNNPYKKSYEIDTALDVFNELKSKYRFPVHWSVKREYYQYNGSGERSNTIMGMFVFVKDRHCDIIYDDNIRLIN